MFSPIQRFTSFVTNSYKNSPLIWAHKCEVESKFGGHSNYDMDTVKVKAEPKRGSVMGSIIRNRTGGTKNRHTEVFHTIFFFFWYCLLKNDV